MLRNIYKVIDLKVNKVICKEILIDKTIARLIEILVP